MKGLNKILLLGSGALKIGEAGEFDYSGTQAIKALKEEGKKVILVNPNIATIQTSPLLADRIYLLPVNFDFVSRVIEKEKPDGILLSFGGQTALNCGIELYQKKILKKFGVKVLGTSIETIIATEDRKIFALKLHQLGFKTARGNIILSIEEGLKLAKVLGYPLMLRTGFALGGTGSGIIKNATILKERLSQTLAVYPQVILEESLYGWKEIEYEVVRDSVDNCITVCNMENFDPMGIHTGESIVVAPSQTLNNEEYFRLRQISIDVIRGFSIIGECNIQFALHPKSGDYRIIEVNARLSRSSALASKATGYPLAYIAAKLALGKKLFEIPNSVTLKTTAFFEPALDYIVVKIPRWDIDKFTNAESSIGSEMKSVGEVMSIGRTFEEAIQKGARMLNDGYQGVIDKNFNNQSKNKLIKRLKTPDTMRLFTICSALRSGITVKRIHGLTKIDPWFLNKLKNIINAYHELGNAKKFTLSIILQAKKLGFSDGQIGDLIGMKEKRVRAKRIDLGIIPYIKRVDTLAGEFPAKTNYLYLTYQANKHDHLPNKNTKKVIVLGSGPYSIGTSVEFDWCAVNTVITLRKNNYKGIMINCNPETVSTDFDYSDYLYFEELTFERVKDIWDHENAPFILSVGGQIPNNLSGKLAKLDIPILGTDPKNIHSAENRESFSRLLDTLKIRQPKWTRAYSLQEAEKISRKINFPILLRPSFVLSGKMMQVLYSEDALLEYIRNSHLNLKEYPLLVTEFMFDAKECDFDGVSQNGKILLFALSEHIEPAGIHSGDSSMILPSATLSSNLQSEIYNTAAKIVKALNVNGPFNIQFLIYQDNLYVIECNLRASRSFPFVSKILKTNFITVATEVMLGKKLKPVKMTAIDYVGVKVPQFSYRKLKGADPVLKVEMNSTGEVAAIGKKADEAYLKAMLSTGTLFPFKKSAMVSLGGEHAKITFLSSCRQLADLGFKLYATKDTAIFLSENNINVNNVEKIYEGNKNTPLDLIRQKELDFIVIVTSIYNDQNKTKRSMSDGYAIRRTAIDFGIPVFTNIESAQYFVNAIINYELNKLSILPLN